MSGSSRFQIEQLLRAGLIVLLGVFLTGCATGLSSARHNYYAGKYSEAEESLSKDNFSGKNRVLLQMARGTIRQSAGDYKKSSDDYLVAYQEAKQLETYSVSKGGASLVVNDNVQAFRGTPFERTMLHAFTAQNHLARADWDNAAVEARRIINSLKPNARGKCPEDAYSRYMAGFCFEMIDDPSNAALQYRKAGELAYATDISSTDGRLRTAVPKETPTGSNQTERVQKDYSPTPWPQARWDNQLVCFVQLGRSPTGSELLNEYYHPSDNLYAEIYQGDKYLGRSYTLANVATLARKTIAEQALKTGSKAVARIAIKEGIAAGVAHGTDNEALGELVRMILLALERPDVRRWETLPLLLQVARVPCSANLSQFRVIVKNSAGTTVNTATITYPITRRGNTFVSFYRNLPTLPKPPAAPINDTPNP